VTIKLESTKVLKEWSAIVDALGRGLQVILQRKYPPSHREFFLYPTYSYTLKKDYLSIYFQEKYQKYVLESSIRKPRGETPIAYYASVVEVLRVGRGELSKLGNLSQYHIWNMDHVMRYFSDSKLEAAYVWILIVYRLPEPKLIKDIGRGPITYADLSEPISTSGAVPVIDEKKFSSILEGIKKALEAPILQKPALKLTEKTLGHDEIRDMIWEIGKYESKVSEKEYPIDNYRLDVVWKRIKAGNPSYAFEVQMGGNFFEALTKLKHAWDMWNSWPILVTTDVYASKAKELLEGSFHEMGHVAKIVDWKKIVKLYELETEVASIKVEIGL